MPKLDELFVCERGKGAWLNGERISVSDRDLKGSVAILEYPNRNDEHRERFDNAANKFLTNTMGILMIYTAVIDLCFVACGRVDIVHTFGCYTWDIMPAGLLVEEAGGKITQVDGTPVDYWQVENQWVLATNGITHAKALELLKK